jgi:RimJ/RimL family protein N-acetyltransferase
MSLDGERIVLREERRADLPFLVSLRNDLETQGWSQVLPPDYTLEMYIKRFEEREFSFKRDDGRFVIEEKDTGELVGMIGYQLEPPRWSAVIGIAIDRHYWGSGYAYEAQELLLQFLFEELGLHIVRLWTQSGNPRAVKLAEKSGFKIGARIREAVVIRGEVHDNLTMDLLREEYYTSRPDLQDHLSETS